MPTSKVQLGYVLTGGGGQAVQGGLSCPPPRISERIDNPQILLHHLLQEYLVERDINIISMLNSNVQLGYVLKSLSKWLQDIKVLLFLPTFCLMGT